MKKKLDFKPHQKVLLPNGKTIRISFINHPGAVIVAPLLNQKTIVMIRQFRPALGRYIYELPAGTIDVPEQPLTCAKRELLEETGFCARRFQKLGEIYPVPGYSTEVIHIFKAEGLTHKDATPEEYEVIENMHISKARVRNYFRHGKIMDGKTICALAHIGWL
ncbi:MAG: NUDIX hydrolase [Candidatus Omnitrophica bacterium]|nr:NUDIX hydrolase [Candidatus Omnitrophota bacterium]